MSLPEEKVEQVKRIISAYQMAYTTARWTAGILAVAGKSKDQIQAALISNAEQKLAAEPDGADAKELVQIIHDAAIKYVMTTFPFSR